MKPFTPRDNCDCLLYPPVKSILEGDGKENMSPAVSPISRPFAFWPIAVRIPMATVGTIGPGVLVQREALPAPGFPHGPLHRLRAYSCRHVPTRRPLGHLAWRCHHGSLLAAGGRIVGRKDGTTQTLGSPAPADVHNDRPDTARATMATRPRPGPNRPATMRCPSLTPAADTGVIWPADRKTWVRQAWVGAREWQHQGRTYRIQPKLAREIH